MTLFDAKTVELQGINLIEASAGTGKTFTLAELYCRLVIEKQLEVSQILVVTYTRAATEELRGRLRKRLVEERQALVTKDDADPKVLKRLKLAIQSFDEAAIFTIHGFCQRALQDFAFESGHFFDMEMVTDEQDIKQAVVDDFWRRYISTADKGFARFLLAQKLTPETLLSAVGSLPGKPYLNYLPLPTMDVNAVQQLVDKNFIHVKQCWLKESEQAIAVLRDADLLNGNKYRKASVEGWITEMQQLIHSHEPPGQLFDKFIKFTRSELEGALKKNKALPELAFWDASQALYDAMQMLMQGRQLQLQHLHQQLADYLNEELPKRKIQSKVQAFDDLLINLQQALHGEQGTKLATQIRKQFQAALIDEFQDTDPIQYDCFSSIFAGSEQPVFFVGDPKQAIYSFRGADIFTYLNAKKASENEFSLDTNWRSHKHLVDAVNTLFDRQTAPFIYDAIPFQKVKAANKGEPGLSISGTTPAPLEFVWLAAEKDHINKGEMGDSAARITATQIAELIQQSAQGEVKLTEKNGEVRPLNGGDIAVLVRSHTQGSAIQQALRAQGINSVQQSRDNVFDSAQAVMLERVLLAVANPGNDSLIATALTTPIFNKTAGQLFDLQNNDTVWLEQVDYFVTLHERWRSSGFIVMLRSMLLELDVQRRLLQQPDGERQLTNLMHLAELVQAYASRRNSTMEAILAWFASQRQASANGLDAAQIRLESDEQLVKVITIHTSKGLEYPVVFCPYLWHQGKPRQKPAVMVFHRGQNNEACAAFGEPGFSEAEPVVALEEKAEDLRLLYVALTRARERCIILWGAAKESEKTAMFRLLHGELSKVDEAQMLDDLKQLAAAHPENIAIKNAPDLSATVHSLNSETANELTARTFSGKVQPHWRVGSFSGLSRGHNIEKPDYDAETITADWPQPTEPRQDRFGFPRGANAGTCLHSLFEHWDFHSTGEDWQQLIAKTLKQFGIHDKWEPVVKDWLPAVVQTTLTEGGELSLQAITKAQRLDEMAFYFPVNELTVQRLKNALTPHISSMPILQPILSQLNFEKLQGFMKGFIDLVFEFDGRFYIADYKSNWLGDTMNDYSRARLDEEMIKHSYPLQYLIYSLALHRYLRLRLPDYDPEQHFGGAYYLFIRGMQPEWGQAGVYFERAPVAVLDALDKSMREQGA